MTDTLVTVGEDGRVILPPDDGPPSEKLPPGLWIRRRLFPGPMNSVLTVVLGAITLYVAYRSLRFVFVTGRWDPVDRNLELFMVGLFPREERWRIVAQLLVMAFGIGLVLGSLRSARRDVAVDTDQPFLTERWTVYAGSYWSIALFFALTLGAFASTPGPWLLAAGVVALAAVGWFIAGRLPRPLRMAGWSAAAVAVVVSFQLLSGTLGWAWFFTTAALVPVINDAVGRLPASVFGWLSPTAIVAGLVVGVGTVLTESPVVGAVAIAVAVYAGFLWRQGDRLDPTRIGLVIAAGAVVTVVYRLIGLGGVDWANWGGLHLNLVATTCAIFLAFPIGMLLALGRRSSLPAVRVMCVAYIEFFRGAPLITFLLAAQFFLGFFLDTGTPLSLITRAIAAVTLFAAAYIAEIIRGGLQAVPHGQVEAGQASGLSPAKITRLIVIPQALRAVIPAMVGQFISLFKDTSLFAIISITEFLDVRALVHGQEAFRGFGIAETLTFVAFGFWAFAFSLSRESQRLERRLGVGLR
ncbi:MAG: amino acid ABC transporter permease [Acidimicrobiales bacterium]